MQAKFLLPSLSVLLALSTPLMAEPIFNGKDLTGWVKRGGTATYQVEAGEIVGTSVANTPNTFLCTEKHYGNFRLEYDFKVDERINSGVQIRSNLCEQETQVQWQGKTIKIPAGRVHGYQVEIDPDVKRGRLWSGGIYDEARRGWLFPDNEKSQAGQKFSEQGRRIFKPGDWNHVKVEAVGDSIKTWLNGTPCADIKDSMTASGFIGLQVHGGMKVGTQVRWRNLSLTELPQP